MRKACIWAHKLPLPPTRCKTAVADDAVRRAFLERWGLTLGDLGPEFAGEELVQPDEQEELDAWTCPVCEKAMTAEARARDELLVMAWSAGQNWPSAMLSHTHAHESPGMHALV